MVKTDYLDDRLYGKVSFDKDDLRLFQTRELARLRQIALSAVPPWTLPSGQSANRFEHSVGVAQLARIVGQKKEFRELSRDLYFASLAHDIGSPPFSHVAEIFQVKIFGKNHEEFLESIIQGSEFGKEVRRQGGDLKTVGLLVKGELRPLSDLLNGTIDIDNLDNTLRIGISMGILQELLYSPERLARSYSAKKGRLVLTGKNVLEDISGWEETRKWVYEFVYGRHNLAPAAMLLRALDFAYQNGELAQDFFFMNDAEAFLFLERKCNKISSNITKMLKSWQFYERVFQFSSPNPNDFMKKAVTRFETRQELATEVAAEIKAAPEDVALYLGSNKGFKKIHIPIVEGSGKEKEHSPQIKLTFMAQVFLHPRHSDKKVLVEKFMKERFL